MKIAITGASGFLGRHVTQALLDCGHNPIIIIRESSKLPSFMETLPKVYHDITDSVEGVYAKCGAPDLMIHLAWSGLPNYRSLHHLEAELPAQFRFLRAMIDSGLPKLVVSGTCFEYGMRCGALNEDLEPLPDNAYGLAKTTLQKMLQMLRKDVSFNLTWVRLFYLYGEGQSESSLYSQLHAAIKAKKDVFPMSNGEQIRDFMPIELFRDEFVRLSLARGEHGIVNLCSGSPISIRRLVEQWIYENDCKIQPEMGRFAYPDYEPLAFWGIRNKLDKIFFDLNEAT
jgi:nucleoside-diphosphate-sugar epimerase